MLLMLKFLSEIFGFAVKKRNQLYDSGKIKAVACPVPVFSIGNISVGGSGKTPFARMLCELLLDAGHRPAIVGRGYKRKSKGEVVVSDGVNILSDWQSAGDEMFMLAESLKVPVIVHDKKYLAARSACKLLDIDCIIVDDGFQHRKLKRDLDIVLIDKKTIDMPYLLPYGRLREPLSSLNRADVVCLPNLEYNFKEVALFINPKAQVINFEIQMRTPYLASGDFQYADINLIMNSPCIALTGIANPDRFTTSLENLNIKVVKHFKFPDHHNFSAKDITGIIEFCKGSGLSTIATTEKDKVRLAQHWEGLRNNNIECLIFPIEMKITKGLAEFKELIESAFVR